MLTPRMITGLMSPDIARCVITDVLEPGQRPRLFKIVSYAWSEQRTIPALRDQVAAAATAARQAGWDGLLQEQRAYLDDFWARADVETTRSSTNVVLYPEWQKFLRNGQPKTIIFWGCNRRRGPSGRDVHVAAP